MSKRSERLRHPGTDCGSSGPRTSRPWRDDARPPGRPGREPRDRITGEIVTVPHRVQMAACPAPPECSCTITSRRECSPSLLSARVPSLRRGDVDVRLLRFHGSGGPVGHRAGAAFMGSVCFARRPSPTKTIWWRWRTRSVKVARACRRCPGPVLPSPPTASPTRTAARSPRRVPDCWPRRRNGPKRQVGGADICACCPIPVTDRRPGRVLPTPHRVRCTR